MKATREERRYLLKVRQALDLFSKIQLTNQRIRTAVRRYGEDGLYISFSGGRDSTVLLYIVRNLYPDIPAVFADTGLEYPEIREFVKTIDNVHWVKPEMNFKRVLETFGYPVANKVQAKYIRQLQSCSKGKRKGMTASLRDKPYFKLAKKWEYLIDAPFKVSEQCCDIMKKKPFRKYEHSTGRIPITGTMAEESHARTLSYEISGCNIFKGRNQKCRPMMFWHTEDVVEFLRFFNRPYSKIYDMGYERTGCMFCAFGGDMFDGDLLNRFQRMKKTHPKLYKYCMNDLGMKKVLDFMKIPIK